VRIVERRTEPFRASPATVMHPRTLELLRPLGVTDALLARGNTSPSARLHLKTRVVPVSIEQLDLRGTAFRHLLLIRQAEVEAVLAAALAERGVNVERGTELVRLARLRHGGARARETDARPAAPRKADRPAASWTAGRPAASLRGGLPAASREGGRAEAPAADG
jgi:2-polyprenyl-6-methoxyphenol hydroxylase-like FAD-dependent oxidoreductase